MPTIMQASKKGVVKSFDLGCEISENYVKSLSGYDSVVQFWSLTLLDVGGGVRTDPTLALSADILWGMHQPIPNFLTFPIYISTFIW